MQSFSISTSCIFAFTYLQLALGELPGLKLDRAWIVAAGSMAMLLVGDISFRQALEGVDFPTLILLFGMMVLVGALRSGGIFERVGHWAMARIRGPRPLLAVTIFLAGFFSAFLVNDVVCLALTPLVIHLSRKLRVEPLPHLMALATAANIGSSATIVGNPQNMIIGSYSGLSYVHFAARLAPIAVICMLIDYAYLSWFYAGSLRAEPGALGTQNFRDESGPSATDRKTLFKALGLTVVTVILFLAGFPQHWAALGAAAALFIGPGRPRGVFKSIDWKLLQLFVGLFVVVHGFEIRVMSRWNIEQWKILLEHPVTAFSAVCAVLSNIVSNVPAVLLFKPIVPHVPPATRDAAWLTLAMASTLAGNFTILGSIANLIVVEGAKREGVSISFWDYFRVGAPLTLITLAVGTACLA